MASSTLRRRVHERQKKTGESYQTALRNYLKAHPKKESLAAAEISPEAATPSPSIFDLVLESLTEVRPVPPPPTPEEKAAQRKRLWSELKTAVRKQLAPRAAERLIGRLRKKELSAEELRGALSYLSALPRGYLAQQQEWVAQQVRLTAPILQLAATIPGVVREAQRILSQAQASAPMLEATRQTIADASALRLASAESETLVKIVRERLDAFNSAL